MSSLYKTFWLFKGGKLAETLAYQGKSLAEFRLSLCSELNFCQG